MRKLLSSLLISRAEQQIRGHQAVILFSFKVLSLKHFQAGSHPCLNIPLQEGGEKLADIFLISSERIFAVFNPVHEGDSRDLEEDGRR